MVTTRVRPVRESSHRWRIDRHGDIILYPQVTRQLIEFGKAEHFEEKFRKLRYFYTKILPSKGWNHYARVNVEFEHQIICE